MYIDTLFCTKVREMATVYPIVKTSQIDAAWLAQNLMFMAIKIMI